MIAATELRRVLLRCPNWLGDTVMAVPVARALRAALPAAELWCLGRWVPAILEAEPGVDRLLRYPSDWRGRWALARELRHAALDLAVLLPNSFESALHARLAGARWRLGYAGDGRTWLLSHALLPSAGPVHQVEAYLALLAPLGLEPPATAPSLRVLAERRAEARGLLAEVGVEPGDRVVGIQLGAALGPSKLWPAARLAALAAALEARGTAVVFLGEADAAPILAAVEAGLPAPARSLIGRDHPAMLPALLAELAVLVSPDSGPAHVAAAVGVPVVALFGPTDPRLSAPIGNRHAVIRRPPPCAPCFLGRCPIDHRCMTAITVEEVAAAVVARLEASLEEARVPAG